MSTRIPAHAQRQMDKLGRGVVVLHSATSQAYMSWRLLVTDPADISFNVYRSANGAAGVKINLSGVISNTTDFLDTGANFSISNAWYVRPVIGGAFPPYDVKFSWFGDFYGDGEYDYLVDRLSTTGGKNQYLQAYKRDGTFLWQIDKGFNSTNTANAYEPAAAAIRSGTRTMSPSMTSTATAKRKSSSARPTERSSPTSPKSSRTTTRFSSSPSSTALPA